MSKITEFWIDPNSMCSKPHKTEHIRWIQYSEYERVVDKYLELSVKQLELAEKFASLTDKYLELKKI